MRNISCLIATCVLSIACGSTGSPEDDFVPDAPNGTQDQAATACPTFTATLQSHVKAGRAYTATSRLLWFNVTAYYAKGTDESLGTTATASKTLYQIGPDRFSTLASKCPTGTGGTGGSSGAGGSSNSGGSSNTGGSVSTGGNVSTPPGTSVTLSWASPAANATLSGTVTFSFAVQGAVNVELFKNGAFFQRCTLSSDGKTASTSVDTTALANGTASFQGMGWNSPAGQAFTASGQSSVLGVTISNSTQQPPPTTPPPPSGSGVTWPSGQDGFTDSGTYNDFSSFGAWRGTPQTATYPNANYLEFSQISPTLLYWNDAAGKFDSFWDFYKGFTGKIVLSMSMAGGTLNRTQAQYDDQLRACANGDYNGYWAGFAKDAKARGRSADNTVVSIAQEFNGNWFKWNPTGVGLDTWKKCWRNVYDSIHSTSDLPLVWTFTSAIDITGWGAGSDWALGNPWDAWPATYDVSGKVIKNYVDIIGIDRYDTKSLNVGSTDWKKTCSRTTDICAVAQKARSLGMKMAVQEWGVERGQYGQNDNPTYIEMMYNFFQDNKDILAFENIFNYRGNGSWNVYPVNSATPNASAKYKELWSKK